MQLTVVALSQCLLFYFIRKKTSKRLSLFSTITLAYVKFKVENLRSRELVMTIFIHFSFILFVQNKMHIKHVNKISEQDNKALRSVLTAALNTIIQVQ